ncbi:hypothetical protein V6N12_003127 [Hibiscus sabdariffa]|uniref:Auxin-responsive protein n=1 Tax=Hibiscus sabdariffa TaxID=183260 RepID=A0ABR2EB03_9ROSI
MSPPLLGVEEEGQSSVSSPAVDCIPQNGLGIKEWNYLGLSDFSSVDSSGVTSSSEDSKNNMNLKATELRLGLPGSQSPERKTELCLLNSGKLDEKALFPLLPSKDGSCLPLQKSVVTGNKRGLSDIMDGFSEMKGTMYTEKNWMFHGAGMDSQSQQPLSHAKYSVPQASVEKDGPANAIQEQPCATNGANLNRTGISNNSRSAPAVKAQVVGWPPVRSFRTKALATSSKNNDEVDGKPGPAALFVKMFSCFTLGQCGAHATPGKEMLSESKLKDLLHGSEYVLTCEDKDGDWMLVGDVPWEMFIEMCKRLKIMKSTDAIGLAPRAMDKSKKDCQT